MVDVKIIALAELKGVSLSILNTGLRRMKWQSVNCVPEPLYHAHQKRVLPVASGRANRKRLGSVDEDAGKYRITPHTLRHTHAVWLALTGADILRIKDRLGHKKLDMTLRYAHLIPDARHDKTKEVYRLFVNK